MFEDEEYVSRNAETGVVVKAAPAAALVVAKAEFRLRASGVKSESRDSVLG